MRAHVSAISHTFSLSVIDSLLSSFHTHSFTWAHDPKVYLCAIWYFKVREDVSADVATTPVLRKGKELTLLCSPCITHPPQHPEERGMMGGGSYPFKRQSRRYRLTALPRDDLWVGMLETLSVQMWALLSQPPSQ